MLGAAAGHHIPVDLLVQFLLVVLVVLVAVEEEAMMPADWQLFLALQTQVAGAEALKDRQAFKLVALVGPV